MPGSLSNARPFLLGSLSQAEGGNTETQQDIGTVSGNATTVKRNSGVPDAIILTFSNVTTPANSILIIIVATAPQLTTGSNTKSVSLQKDDVQVPDGLFNISTIDNDSIVEIEKIFVDVNPEAGTHNYTLVQKDNASFGGVTATLMFITTTDTHHCHEQSILPD